MVEVVAELSLLVIIEDGFGVGYKLFPLLLIESHSSIVNELEEDLFDLLFDRRDPKCFSMIFT